MAPPTFKRRLGNVDAVQYDGTMTPDLTNLLAGVEHQWVGTNDGVLQIRYEDGWVVPKTGEWIVRSPAGEVWTVADAVFTDAYEPL